MKPGDLAVHATNPVAEPSTPEPASERNRAAHRAATELRRGTPVLLTGEAPLVLLAAETASLAGMAEFEALAGDLALLLLAPSRAAAVLHRPVQQVTPVALRLPPNLLDPAHLRALADPTAEQTLPSPPDGVCEPPALASAALALAKLGRLLPAVLAAPARAGAVEQAARLNLLVIAGEAASGLAPVTASDLQRVAEAPVPLQDAPDARVVAFREPASGLEHLAILIGQPERTDAPLVRLHSECFTGDVLGSLRCDCGPQLRGAIARMAAEGAGALLYLAQEGRGIGLVNKLRAYALQDRGLDTVDANRALGWNADERSFSVAAAMLDLLGIRRLRLLTNNPDKVAALVAHGVDVVRREQHAFAANGINDAYLAAKASRFGHLLD